MVTDFLKREYYSVRTGLIPKDSELEFSSIKKLFCLAYRTLEGEGYFQKYFGTNCTDGYMEGELGPEVETIIEINLRKSNLFPFAEKANDYNEDDLFDVIEFLHDHSSKGREGYYHGWNNCGYHYQDFNDEDGQSHFREVMNPILAKYKGGYEISPDGQILIIADKGLTHLFDAEVVSRDKESIDDKINSAILKFRRHKASLDERRDAIRDLADVLEYLKKDIILHLDEKDGKDLFNIANNFAIRHHNPEQKVNYDKAIWYSWMFYFYLATIHALLHTIKKAKPALQ